MYTKCFIYNKIIISCFYGLLFLIFNVLIFTFVKLKLHTYRNSCLPSGLTKIKTSSRHNTKLRLLSKKLKIAKQFTFSSQIFITHWSDPILPSTRMLLHFCYSFIFLVIRNFWNLAKFIAFAVMNHPLEILKRFINRSYVYNSKICLIKIKTWDVVKDLNNLSAKHVLKIEAYKDLLCRA